MSRQGGHNARVWVLAVFLLGIYLGLLGRLCFIQGMERDKFRSLARSQHFVRLARTDRRGTIFDRRGRTLAVSVQVPSVALDPRGVVDYEETAWRLAELLGVDARPLLSRMRQRLPRVCLKRGLSRDDEERIRRHPAVRRLGDALEVAKGAVFARPPAIADPQAAAAALAPVLRRDADALRDDLAGIRQFIWVKRKVSDDEAKRVAAATLPGVFIEPEYKRAYPHGELACQLLGFVGVDEQGLEGLERALDHILAPTPGSVCLQRDAAGRYIATTQANSKPPRPGADIQLSIDAVIQGYLEDALRETWDLWGPKGAFGVVLDPRTGDVLAAASLPAFDPNHYSEYDPGDLKNRARARFIADWMEPGSVMKPFVFSAALNERVITENTPICCENGMWLIGGRRRFRDVHAYGTLPASMVLIKSSNIGTAKIGLRLGPKRLYRYLTRFGFGRPTGFELPGENPGMLRPPDQWTSYSLPSICVGQEICVTSIQMTLAYCAIAHDGLVPRPRLVQRVRRPDGTWSERPARTAGRAIPPAIARRVRRVLCGVVEKGTGRRARIPAYTIGGKTGTAQKPTVGGFSHSKVMCSFVGMAPIENPALVVAVTFDEPTKTAGGRHYGGTVAAPAVAQVIKQSLPYLGVPPDKPQALARLGYGDKQRGATR